MASNSWKQKEFTFVIVYAICFYFFITRRSLKLSQDHYQQLWGLRSGWLANRLNDVSDGQCRNFRGNLPILTAVFGAFIFVATSLQKICHLRASGMSNFWLLISLVYLIYLHRACVLFILSIASFNFLLVKASVGLFGQLPAFQGTFSERSQSDHTGYEVASIIRKFTQAVKDISLEEEFNGKPVLGGLPRPVSLPSRAPKHEMLGKISLEEVQTDFLVKLTNCRH